MAFHLPIQRPADQGRGSGAGRAWPGWPVKAGGLALALLLALVPATGARGQNFERFARQAIQDFIPPLTPLDHQWRLVEASSKALAGVEGQSLYLYLSKDDLNGLLPPAVIKKVGAIQTAQIEKLAIRRMRVKLSPHRIGVEGQLTLRLARPAVSFTFQVEGVMQMALAGDRLYIYPALDRASLLRVALNTPKGEGRAVTSPQEAQGALGLTFGTVSWITENLLPQLNRLLFEKPVTLDLKLKKHQSLDLAKLGGKQRLTVTRGGEVVFKAYPAVGAVLVGPGGVELMLAISGQPLANQPVVLRRSQPKAPPAGEALLEERQREYGQKFSQKRALLFGLAAPPATSALLVSKQAVAATIRRAFEPDVTCLKFNELELPEKKFRQTLRIYSPDDVKCGQVGMDCPSPSSCRTDCDGLAAELRPACLEEAERCQIQNAAAEKACLKSKNLAVARCKLAKQSLELAKGVLTIGDLEGTVRVRGEAEACLKSLDISDDLSRLNLRAQMEAKLKVEAQMAIDTSLLGKLVCLIPFQKTFTSKGKVSQLVALNGAINAQPASEGAINLSLALDEQNLGVKVSPTPWGQMVVDPVFVVNCSLLTFTLPTLTVSSALVGQRTPGVSELVTGNFLIPTPTHQQATTFQPIRIELPGYGLTLDPVWEEKAIGVRARP